MRTNDLVQRLSVVQPLLVFYGKFRQVDYFENELVWLSMTMYATL